MLQIIWHRLGYVFLHECRFSVRLTISRAALFDKNNDYRSFEEKSQKKVQNHIIHIEKIPIHRILLCSYGVGDFHIHLAEKEIVQYVEMARRTERGQSFPNDLQEVAPFNFYHTLMLCRSIALNNALKRLPASSGKSRISSPYKEEH